VILTCPSCSRTLFKSSDHNLSSVELHIFIYNIHPKITVKMVHINCEVFRLQSSSGSSTAKSCEQENSATTDLQSERVFPLTEIKTSLNLILCLVAS
jgi:hypothetical protein